MKHKIYITNRQKAVAVTPETRKWIKNATAAALAYEQFDGQAEVSVTFVDRNEIHQMNLEYRNVDRPTDVLSFPLFEEEDLTDAGAVPLGDIVLCLEQAQAQAQEYGHSLEREVCFLCVHSVLHLLGYDHENSKEDEEEMFLRQEAVLNEMGLTR
jgi:probable rRNA maturation factor